MATLVIWFLQTFDVHFSIVTDSKDSILAMVASVIAPIFKPMGFGDWRISTALITGFMAKESVVSTLSVLFGSTATLLGCITPLAAASLLAFCLLYTPCVAAIASVKRELGGQMGSRGCDRTVRDRMGSCICSASGRRVFLLIVDRIDGNFRESRIS